jgi:hypothetical protein
MFGAGQRTSLGGASPGPGVGAYTLRSPEGVYALRPGTSPFGSAAKRQPLGGAPARGVPPPTQYVGHSDPFQQVSFFGDTRRKAMGEPNGVPGVGEYSLATSLYVASPRRRKQAGDGVQVRGSTSIPSPRRDNPPSPRRRDLEAAQAMAEAAAQEAEARMAEAAAASGGLGGAFGAGAATARSTGGVRGGASFGSVARKEEAAAADPVADARAMALAAALAAAAAAVPLPDLRSYPRQNALPFSDAPRFGNDETLPPGPGAYELKVLGRERGALPFNSRPEKGGAMDLLAGRTSERVGPGSYDYDRVLKFSPRSVPAALQCFENSAARDPLSLDLNARLNKGAPGVGDYELAAGRSMQRIAGDAPARGALYQELGGRRRAREVELDAQLYRFPTNVAQATLQNGVSPRVVEPTSPRSPRARGYASPGFGKSALRKGAFDTVEGPGPADYFAVRQNAQRLDAARACTANTAFSTSKRPGGGWDDVFGDEVAGAFDAEGAAPGAADAGFATGGATFGSGGSFGAAAGSSESALAGGGSGGGGGAHAHSATIEALSPRGSRPATRGDMSSRGSMGLGASPRE